MAAITQSSACLFMHTRGGLVCVCVVEISQEERKEESGILGPLAFYKTNFDPSLL